MATEKTMKNRHSAWFPTLHQTHKGERSANKERNSLRTMLSEPYYASCLLFTNYKQAFWPVPQVINLLVEQARKPVIKNIQACY